MPQWKQYSGTWPLQQQMQAVAAGTWTGLPYGALYGWGANTYGNLGQNDRVYRSSPVQVGALTNWYVTAAVGQSTLAVKQDGTMWSWGYNIYGQLGQNDRVYRSSPVQIGALTNWAKVFKNANNAYAIKTDGTLWVWGRNENGSLGLDDVIARSSPVQLGANTWGYVAGIDRTTVAVRQDGTMWSWGDNENIGALGTNQANVRRSSPVQIGSLNTWESVNGGSIEFLAKKTDGTIWSWGWNDAGQLGDGTVINRSSPVQIGALTTWLRIGNANSYKYQLVVKNDNTLWCWGSNAFGELGQNNLTARSSPVQVGSDTTWLQPTSAYTASVVVKTNGTLWAWGGNFAGVIGQNDVVNRSSPVQVGSETTWISAFGGNGSVFVTKRAS